MAKGGPPQLLQLSLGEPRDEHFAWRVIVISTLLQRTSHKQARPAAEVLLKEYPTAARLAAADREHVKAIVRGAGFAEARTERLQELSAYYADFLEHDYDPEPAPGVFVPGPRPETVRRWRGIGKYVEDAVRLIVWEELGPEVDDPKLAEYETWLRSQQSD